MAQRYLYGASVQGIQSFIFQTDKLKEIIGASELVEVVCTTLFANLVFNGPETPSDLETLKDKRERLDQMLLDEKNKDCLMAAGGNIKYLFDEEQCKNVYRHFPRQVALFAPGITISQAVVPLDKEQPEQADINKLEDKLRAKRNQPVSELESGWAIITRVPATGKPAQGLKKRGEERKLLDAATKQKLEAGRIMANSKLLNTLVGDFQVNKKIPYEMEDLVQGNEKSWIAVVHADGNSLGQIISELAGGSSQETGNVFRQFSRELDKATKLAAQKAFEQVFGEELNNPDKKNDEKLGIRPVVIGGDDLTFVCRADVALEFTRCFLEFFEETTLSGFAPLVNNMGLSVNRLTACAGIAFIKKNYPLHYGLELAETLCSKAKKASKQHKGEKGYVPASLAFHKVQDSFVTDWELIKSREMVFDNKESKKKVTIDFDFGPYAIHENYAGNASLSSIKELMALRNVLERDDAPKSGLRQWLTELTLDFWSGASRIDRLLMVLKQRKQTDMIEKLGIEKYSSKELNKKETSSETPCVVKSPLYHALMLTTLKD